MKSKIFFIIAILLVTKTFAHKDKLIQKKYGNVKVLIKTGFDYSDISKIKVIGRLSEQVSKQLKYNDTIFVEYIHDYTKRYIDDVYLLENNNSNFNFIDGIDTKNESNNKGISIRIYADNINVISVLKLIEFSIVNKENLNSYISIQKIKCLLDNDDEWNMEASINSSKFIENIIKKDTSELLKNIIVNKTVVESKKDYGIEIYWKDDKFIFEYKYLKGQEKENKTLLKTQDYYYSKEFVNRALVFINRNDFVYLDTNDKFNKQNNKLKAWSNWPVEVIHRFENKLLIHSGYKNLNMYLIRGNKIISEFE